MNDSTMNREKDDMFNLVLEENHRLKAKLSALRRLIMQVEPTVMFDGRFEEMMLAPIHVIDVAKELIEKIPQLQQDGAAAPQ